MSSPSDQILQLPQWIQEEFIRFFSAVSQKVKRLLTLNIAVNSKQKIGDSESEINKQVTLSKKWSFNRRIHAFEETRLRTTINFREIIQAT